MKKTNKRITPELITELSRCEIFVFGSNLEGQHHGGAARTAHEKFGAEWGVGDGPTGRCYAIPTMLGHRRHKTLRRKIYRLRKSASAKQVFTDTCWLRNCRL